MRPLYNSSSCLTLERAQLRVHRSSICGHSRQGFSDRSCGASSEDENDGAGDGAIGAALAAADSGEVTAALGVETAERAGVSDAPAAVDCELGAGGAGFALGSDGELEGGVPALGCSVAGAGCAGPAFVGTVLNAALP